MSDRADARYRQVTAWKHARAVLLLPCMNTVLIPAGLIAYFADAGSMALSSVALIAMPVAVVLLAAGLTLVIRSISLFVTRGDGTLAPWDPTRKLVTVDIYRYSRNPMKLGLFLILIGECLLLESLALCVWASVFVVANVGYIRWFEEPGLRQRFGQSYDDYCRSVSRWLGRAAQPVEPSVELR